MGKKKKVAGYVRVSTEDQGHGVSIDNQKDRIKDFAAAKEWELIEIYEDIGESGKDMQRSGIQELISLAKDNVFDVVIVYKVDRLTRKQKDLWHLLEDVFEKNDIGFISITEAFDTTTAQGKAFLGMLGVFAQLERDTISERTRDALHYKKKNGEAVGCPPAGMKIKKKKLIVDKEASGFVKFLFDLKNKYRGRNKLSLAKTAEILNDNGYKPVRGKRFYASTVRHMLQNPLLIKHFS